MIRRSSTATDWLTLHVSSCNRRFYPINCGIQTSFEIWPRVLFPRLAPVATRKPHRFIVSLHRARNDYACLIFETCKNAQTNLSRKSKLMLSIHMPVTS